MSGARYELRVVELLTEIRDGQRTMIKLLEELRPTPKVGDPRYADLVRAISETAGDRLFTSNELIVHAALPQAAVLRDAIIAALGRLNTKALGKLLRRIEGAEHDGLSIQRIGDERDGAVWRVMRLSKAERRAHFA